MKYRSEKYPSFLSHTNGSLPETMMTYIPENTRFVFGRCVRIFGTLMGNLDNQLNPECMKTK
jgi:hypothetical protein